MSVATSLVYRKKTRTWYPKGLKTKREKEVYDKLKLRPVGEWSADLVEGNTALQEKHWEFVSQVLEEAKEPKNKKEAELIVKRAALSPAQRLVILYEVSLKRPLSPGEFEEYISLFRALVGERQYRALFGKRSPAQLRKMDEVQLRQTYGGKAAVITSGPHRVQ